LPSYSNERGNEMTEDMLTQILSKMTVLTEGQTETNNRLSKLESICAGVKTDVIKLQEKQDRYNMRVEVLQNGRC